MTIIKNLKWGLRWGLIVAVAFTGMAVLVAIATGSESDPRGGPPLLNLVGFYFLGGVVGGSLLGLVRPVTAHKIGAIAVGTFVAAVLLSLLEYLFVIKDHWNSIDTFLVAFLSLIAGPVTTLMIWEGNSRIKKDASGTPRD